MEVMAGHFGFITISSRQPSKGCSYYNALRPKVKTTTYDKRPRTTVFEHLCPSSREVEAVEHHPSRVTEMILRE